MLKKLRRERKDSAIDVSPLPLRGAAMASVSEENSNSNTTTTTTMGIGFFDLPAELRNEIYELVISDATLNLPTPHLLSALRKPGGKLRLKKKKPGTTAPINSLLLASKQTRKEYLSVLLSTIPVEISIHDLDFTHLTRVSSSLNAADLASLHANKNLALHLHTRNCTQRSLQHLLRWLAFRAAQPASQRLPWRYEFPLGRLLPPSTMGKVRLLRELEYYADSVATLAVDLETEAQRAELAEVVRAHEVQAAALEEDLEWLGQRSKALSRNVRGLAGGGFY